MFYHSQKLFDFAHQEHFCLRAPRSVYINFHYDFSTLNKIIACKDGRTGFQKLTRLVILSILIYIILCLSLLGLCVTNNRWVNNPHHFPPTGGNTIHITSPFLPIHITSHISSPWNCCLY